MVTLQYFDGEKWTAWISLGRDNQDYRTIDENGNVLTDKTIQ